MFSYEECCVFAGSLHLVNGDFSASLKCFEDSIQDSSLESHHRAAALNMIGCCCAENVRCFFVINIAFSQLNPEPLIHFFLFLVQRLFEGSVYF